MRSSFQLLYLTDKGLALNLILLLAASEPLRIAFLFIPLASDEPSNFSLTAEANTALLIRKPPYRKLNAKACNVLAVHLIGPVAGM